jgi:hypothetical protein
MPEDKYCSVYTEVKREEGRERERMVPGGEERWLSREVQRRNRQATRAQQA